MTEFAQPGGPQNVAGLLQHGLDIVEELSRKLQNLDALMLTGRPYEISDAAITIENAIRQAAPDFATIAAIMHQLGAQNLASAALALRAAQLNDAAGLAEALRRALARFAQKSVGANRRAQTLNRGLNAALRTLQAFGVHETGRLIAEA